MPRVHEAMAAGARQSEIGTGLFGADRVAREQAGRSALLRSRVWRLVADARMMAKGGYRPTSATALSRCPLV